MVTSSQPHCYLVADVGGTNTRIALTDGAAIRGDTIRRYRNLDYDTLADILRDYMGHFSPKVTAATFAMAGAIENGKGYLTNRDWHFDTDTLSDVANTKKSYLINDLSAQGYALHLLPDHLFQDILTGQGVVADSPHLVVGIGTGFNVAQVHNLDGKYHVVPAETGHATLPAETEEIAAMIAHLRNTTHPFVAMEDILSGRGLENCYRYVAHNKNRPDLNAADIVAAAVGGEPLAHQTLVLFTKTCGAVIADLALHFLPFGGITLVGGVARSTLPYLQSSEFSSAFRAKGRLSYYMDRFSVNIVNDDHSALTGCIAYTQQKISA